MVISAYHLVHSRTWLSKILKNYIGVLNLKEVAREKDILL